MTEGSKNIGIIGHREKKPAGMKLRSRRFDYQPVKKPTQEEARETPTNDDISPYYETISEAFLGKNFQILTAPNQDDEGAVNDDSLPFQFQPGESSSDTSTAVPNPALKGFEQKIQTDFISSVESQVDLTETERIILENIEQELDIHLLFTKSSFSTDKKLVGTDSQLTIQNSSFDLTLLCNELGAAKIKLSFRSNILLNKAGQAEVHFSAQRNNDSQQCRFFAFSGGVYNSYSDSNTSRRGNYQVRLDELPSAYNTYIKACLDELEEMYARNKRLPEEKAKEEDKFAVRQLATIKQIILDFSAQEDIDPRLVAQYKRLPTIETHPKTSAPSLSESSTPTWFDETLLKELSPQEATQKLMTEQPKPSYTRTERKKPIETTQLEAQVLEVVSLSAQGKPLPSSVEVLATGIGGFAGGGIEGPVFDIGKGLALRLSNRPETISKDKAEINSNAIHFTVGYGLLEYSTAPLLNIYSAGIALQRPDGTFHIVSYQPNGEPHSTESFLNELYLQIHTNEFSNMRYFSVVDKYKRINSAESPRGEENTALELFELSDIIIFLKKQDITPEAIFDALAAAEVEYTRKMLIMLRDTGIDFSDKRASECGYVIASLNPLVVEVIKLDVGIHKQVQSSPHFITKSIALKTPLKELTNLPDNKQTQETTKVYLQKPEWFAVNTINTPLQHLFTIEVFLLAKKLDETVFQDLVSSILPPIDSTEASKEKLPFVYRRMTSFFNKLNGVFDKMFDSVDHLKGKDWKTLRSYIESKILNQIDEKDKSLYQQIVTASINALEVKLQLTFESVPRLDDIVVFFKNLQLSIELTVNHFNLGTKNDTTLFAELTSSETITELKKLTRPLEEPTIQLFEQFINVYFSDHFIKRVAFSYERFKDIPLEKVLELEIAYIRKLRKENFPASNSTTS